MLEVLESSVLDDLERATAVIAACRDLGVGFALDDFGTGYSSLANLKHLPFSEIKIDRSFVHDMLLDAEDLAIIQGIVGLARAFQLRLVAEGVECNEHARALLRIGCTHAQGFGIARPMPSLEVSRWLGTWSPDPSWARTPELPVGAHMALFVQAAYRYWLQQTTAWLQGGVGDAPQAPKPTRGLGRWLAELPLAARANAAAQDVWLHYQQLHQHFDVAVSAYRSQGMDAARAMGGPLLASGECFIRDLETLIVAMGEDGAGR
jgi:hypothetical protein